MIISELIAELEEYKQLHGDIPVYLKADYEEEMINPPNDIFSIDAYEEVILECGWKRGHNKYTVELPKRLVIS